MPSLTRAMAMELANLVLLAYGMYEDFKENTILSSEAEWVFPEFLTGSVERNFDYHNPQSLLSGEQLGYQVLGELWHTDRPVGLLHLETVPFGFIARRSSGPAEASKPPSAADEVFVILRGTLNSQEWANNFEFKKTEAITGIVGAGFIHSGFNAIFERSYLDRLKSWRGLYTRAKRRLLRVAAPTPIRQRSIREAVEHVLFNTKMVHPAARIYIAGHSLGGALALLAGRVLANRGAFMASTDEEIPENPYHKTLTICTFGGPRVGDAAFARSLQGVHVVRYVNTEDIVPTVPPPTNRLLGSDMRLTPEGLRAFKRDGVELIANVYQAQAGALRASGSNTACAPFTHVGECRSFTLSRDSLSFNHNHQETYREGVELIG